MAETSFLWRDTAMRIRERFNPRAPCGARRHICSSRPCRIGFQPTRPLRGATDYLDGSALGLLYFNPRAPCGARLSLWNIAPREAKFQPTRPLRGATRDWHATVAPPRDISTHAPLAGRDKISRLLLSGTHQFQPTRPLRGATHPRWLLLIWTLFQPTRPLRGAT